MGVTWHLRISGRVQGVGYRDALRREALAKGVAGWVRNRRDGTVEAVLQGAPAAVDAVIAWAQFGPPAARVARVARVDARAAEREFDQPYAGFDCLPAT
jgi:acylphosphatase